MSDNPNGAGKEIGRKTRTDEEEPLLPLDLPFDWEKHWWGMPAFVHGDARPSHSIAVNFMSWEDVQEFADRLGVRVTQKTNSLWFPKEDLSKPQDWEYI
jgi:hypothetical protein